MHETKSRLKPLGMMRKTILTVILMMKPTSMKTPLQNRGLMLGLKKKLNRTFNFPLLCIVAQPPIKG